MRNIEEQLRNLLTLIFGSQKQTFDNQGGQRIEQTEPNLFQRIKGSRLDDYQAQPNTPSPTASPTMTPTPTPSTAQYAKTGRNPKSAEFNADSSVIDAIQNAAKQYGVQPELLFDIAIQESGLNPKPAPNPASTAGGLFQFTEPTWQTVQNYQNMPNSTLQLPNQDRFDPQTAALAAAYLIANGQLGRWDASKNEGNNAWGQFYNEEELKPYYKQTLRR